MNIRQMIKNSFLYRPLHYINYKRLRFKELRQLKEYESSSYSKKIKSMENIESGKCFIIGNGPSLSCNDLQTLADNNVICFSSNRIYSLYSQVKWRPKYYVCQDDKVMEKIYEDLPFAISNSEKSFISINNYKHDETILSLDKTCFYFIVSRLRKEWDVEVSEDISKGICGGMTVTFAMMEIAAYLGFNEIYLLGVDHNFQSVNTQDGDRSNHFKGIKTIDASDLYAANYELMNRSFIKFKEFAEAHDIKVYNATRGGKLEIFERVDFDKLFERGAQNE